MFITNFQPTRFPKDGPTGRILNHLNNVGAEYHEIAKIQIRELDDFLNRVHVIGRWAEAAKIKFIKSVTEDFEGDENEWLAKSVVNGIATSYFNGFGEFGKEITKGLDIPHYSEEEQMAMLEASINARKSKK